MPSLRTLVVLLGMMAAAGGAGAQQPPLAQVDADGTCPANVSALRAKGGSTSRDVEEIMRSEKQVAKPEAELYRTSDLAPFEKIKSKLKFGDKVVVYQTSNASPPNLFVGVSGQKLCGWLKSDDVYSIRQPMRLNEIAGAEHIKDTRGRPSALVAKIVAMALHRDGRLFKVPVFAEPHDVEAGGEPPKATGEVGYFAILNVYDHRSGKGGKCRDSGDASCFFLVGGLSQGAGDLAEIPQIRGWVRASDVTLWPSALSLYYKEGASGVRIFRTDAAAVSAARGSKPADRDVLAVKADRHGEPKVRNIPRFPAIEARPFQGKQLYRIVLAGDVCGSSDRACMERAISGTLAGSGGEQELQARGEIGKGLFRSKGLDLLLVIDGTESMDKYFAPIIQAVDDVAREAQRKQLRVRFAAMTFGDYKGDRGDTGEVIARWVTRFRTQDPAGGLRTLNRSGLVGSDPQKDLPEAPFAALVKATSDAEWDPESAFKVVVWIGDHGNRPKGTHKTNGGFTLNETVDETDVVAALAEKKASFAAIQVRGAYREAENRRMVANAEAIVARLGSKDPRQAPFKVLTADTTAAATPDEITNKVRDKLTEIMNAPTTAESIVLGKAQGKSDADLGVDLGLPGAQLAQWYIENELKLTPDKLKEISDRVQAILPGWIVQDDRSPSFAYWLALREIEFRTVYDAMNRLCDTLGGGDPVTFKDHVMDTMTAVLKGATFEEPDKDMPIDEFLSKKFSIPKENFAEILRQSIREFAEWFVRSTVEQQAKYRGDICRKAKMFELVSRKERVALADIQIKDGRVQVAGNREPFEWDWAIDTGIRYFFLPLELLP